MNGQHGTQTCGDDARFGPCIPDGFASVGSADVGGSEDVISRAFGLELLQAPVQGVLLSKSKAPVGGQEVVVDVDGVTYRTVTNPRGEFFVFGPRPGVMQLHVAGSAAMQVSLSQDPTVINVL